ncbi:MAG: phosphoglycerate dehydrogenase [Phycisphaerae bacterium]
MKILLTTTSFQDTPGKHQELLNGAGFEIVRARGPLSEAQMLDILAKQGPFDGLLNGDDQITAKVIDALLPQMKVIAKYGIGLDSIDVQHATNRKIPVLFTPGVNETTVAEHVFGLMVAVAKQFWFHLDSVKSGRWDRKTGCELRDKTLGVVGMGRIGKEVIKRGVVFGMKPMAFDPYFDEAFAAAYGVPRMNSFDELFAAADVISLHTNLSDETRGMVNKRTLGLMKDGTILINTARGGLVVEDDIAQACKSGKLRGYGTDVVGHEPIDPHHPFIKIDNVIITPHIGSRTYESVQRQGLRAAANLVNFLKGNSDYIQANKF